MLQSLILVLDLAAQSLALLAPVAILHWLLLAAGTPAYPPLALLTQLFAPMNASVHHLLPNLPTMPFNGQTVTMDQVILGLGFVVGFLSLSTLSGWVRQWEQQWAVQASEHARQKEFKRLSESKEARAGRIRMDGVLVSLFYPAASGYGETPDWLEPIIQQWTSGNAKAVLHHPDEYHLAFQTTEQVMSFLQQLRHQVRLRQAQVSQLIQQPMPLQVVVEGIPRGAEATEQAQEARALSRYARNNQILIGPRVKRALDQSPEKTPIPVESLGIFMLPNQQQVELYKAPLSDIH